MISTPIPLVPNTLGAQYSLLTPTTAQCLAFGKESNIPFLIWAEHPEALTKCSFVKAFPQGASLTASDPSPLRGASQLQPSDEERAAFLKRDTSPEKERRSCQREGKLPSARAWRRKSAG